MTDFIYDDMRIEGDDFMSTAIDGLAYNRETKELWVEFRGGDSYIYSDVEESTFNLFSYADSLGVFYRKHISGKYTSSGPVDVELVRRGSEDAIFTGDNVLDDLLASASTYGVKWTNGTLHFEPTYTALSEDDAVAQFNAAIQATGITDAKIVSVTHYF